MNLHRDLKHLLSRFNARRRRLLFVRGSLSASALLVLGVMLSAALDGYLIFEEKSRLYIAALLYCATLVFFWLRAGKNLIRTSSARELAGALEYTAPELKGALLSAVELGVPIGVSRDSETLRALHQERTAKAVESLDCNRLLPWSKLRFEITAFASAALLLLILLGLDGEHFGRRCLRFLLPTSEIERLSETQFMVLNPAPNEGFVPEGEPLEIRAQIKGRQPLRPTLEFFDSAGKGGIAKMDASDAEHFGASLNVASAPLDYRIKAGDGATKLFHLIPTPRPHVSQFLRQYHPPAYTGLPERFDDTPGGSMEAVQGTSVDLSFRTDQPVSGGSLHISLGQITETIPLTKDPADQTLLHAQLVLQKSGVYFVHLIATATNFSSSKGSPQEIRVALDSPPVVALHLPEEDVLLTLGDKVEFRGTADDDFGLLSVTQHISINRGSWQPLSSLTVSGKHHDLRQTWDPLQHQPKVGDTIAVRFMVLDTKGQAAESRVLHFSFAPPEFFQKINPALTAQREVTRRVEEISRQANEAARSLQEAKTESESKAPDALKQNQAIARAKQALDAASEGTAIAREHVLAEIRRESSLDALADLKAQAQALNRIEFGELTPARRALDRVTPSASDTPIPPLGAEALRVGAVASAKGASLANAIKDAAQTRQSTMEAAALAKTAKALSSAQALTSIQEPPLKQPNPATAIQTQGPSQAGNTEADMKAEEFRRQQVNQAASSDLLRGLQSLSEHSQTAATKLKTPRSALQIAQQNADTALKEAQAAEARGEAKGNVEKAKAAGDVLAKNLSHVSEALEGLESSLREAALKARQKLSAEQLYASERLIQSSRELEALENKKQISLPEKRMLTEMRLEAEASVLRADATIEASRRNASAQIESDLRTAATALDAVTNTEDALAESRAKTAAIARALQTLEAVASVDEARKTAESLATQSTPGSATPSVEATKNVSSSLAQLQKLAPEMRRAGLPEDAAAAASNAFDEVQKGARDKNKEAFDAAAKSMAVAANAISDSALKARTALNEISPSLPERIEKLALEAAAASQSTQKLTATPSETGPPVPKGLIQEEQQLAQKIDGIRKEFQANASAQSSMTAEGRALARDADAAAAQLKDPAHALKLLKQANASKSEARATLQRASDQQRQTAEKLTQLAEHFRNIASGDAEKIAASRKSLRNAEQQTGVQEQLEARENRASVLSTLAKSPGNDPSAQAKLEQLAAAHKEASTELQPGSSAQSFSTAEASEAINRALEAMKSGDVQASTQAAQTAANAQHESDRLARSSEDATVNPSKETPSEAAPSNSNGLPELTRKGSADWGHLPQRVATDLMEGKREKAPPEYRTAVDAYFQAVAEKARGLKVRP